MLKLKLPNHVHCPNCEWPIQLPEVEAYKLIIRVPGWEDHETIDYITAERISPGLSIMDHVQAYERYGYEVEIVELVRNPSR